MTVAEARIEVWSFFKEARRLGLRTLLITHGKGLGNKEKSGSGVLKGLRQPLVKGHRRRPSFPFGAATARGHRSGVRAVA
jgi:DNA-nicking Smr family endonuclease